MLHLVVSGSRDWGTDPWRKRLLHRVFDDIDGLAKQRNFTGMMGTQYVCLTHGGASRIRPREGQVSLDMLADEYARRLGWKVNVVKPDWNTHGKAAGILRNIAMLDELYARLQQDTYDYECSGILFAGFRWNESKGTGHAIKYAQEKGIPSIIYQLTQGY